jgi:hypothetical protein
VFDLGSEILLVGIQNHEYLTESLKCEYEWLNTVRLTDQDLSSNNIFAEISKKTNTIKENCESTAIEEYLNSL